MQKTASGSRTARGRTAGIVLVTLFGLLLAACGHRPEVMVPVAFDPLPQNRVDMLVATTRAPSDDPKVRYSGERGQGLGIDNVVVSIPPEGKRKVGEIQLPPERGKPDPDKAFLVTKAQQMDEPGLKAWFRRTSGPKRRVLLFVHGFNNTYSEAVLRFAQITHDVKVDAAPVLFTWPSRGSALDYVYDRESTMYSRSGLVEALERAVANPEVSEVTILAHSMGTWLTMEALRELALKHGQVSGKIHNVVLASPDIDIDVFQRQVLEMGPKHPRITIYYSRNDRALKLSTFLAGDVDRLGAADLRPYKPALAAYGISVIDATDAKQSDPLGHSAFAEDSEMLASLTARLSSQQLDSQNTKDAQIGKGVLTVLQQPFNIVGLPVRLIEQSRAEPREKALACDVSGPRTAGTAGSASRTAPCPAGFRQR